MITNDTDNIVVNGSSSADQIENTGSYVTLKAGGGNDTVTNDGGDNSFIDGGDGNDNIEAVESSYVTAAGGAGNDNITGTYYSSSINGGAGIDNIAVTADDTTITGGDGNDIIEGVFVGSSVDGGNGNDYIELQSNDEGETAESTIVGGKGNDTIVNSAAEDYGDEAPGNVYQYASGDGNDIIIGATVNDTLNIKSGSISNLEIVGDDAILTIGTGKITLKNAAYKTIWLQNGNGNAEEYELTDESPGSNTFISLTSGADYYYNEADGVTIDAGAGNDTLENDGSDVSISAGAGNDRVTNTGDNVTVSGGAGNDSVENSGSGFVYEYTGGKDTITGFNEGDEIIIGKGYTTAISGNDWVIKIGSGSITIQDAAEQTIIVDGDEVVPPEEGDTILGTAKADTLTNDDDEKVIDALAGNDKIYNSGNNVTIIGGKGNDSIYNEGDGNIYQYANGDGKDVIEGFGENDTITITSGSYSYSVSGNDFVVKIGSGSIILKDAATQTIHINDEVIEPTEPVELPGGWVYGNKNNTLLKATLATAANEIDLNEGYGEGVVTVDGSKITSGVAVTGNDEGNSIKGGKGADYITGGTGDDTVSLGAGADVYVYTGGDDLIQDYASGQDTIQLVGAEFVNTSVSGSNRIFSTDKGNITVKNGNKANSIILADENGDTINWGGEVLPDGWKKDSAKALLQATVKTAETEIDLNEDYGEGITKVDSSKITDNVIITGNGLNNSIKAGTGSDTIDGGTGDDTITGGKGADVFIYSGGDDIITDYGTGADTIQIETSNISVDNIATVGSNLVVSTNMGDLVVKGGKSKEVIIVDEEGEQIWPEPTIVPEGWSLDSAKKKISATTASAVDIDLNDESDYGVAVTVVDASKTTGVSIVGNGLDNSIKGGAGDDVLDGGEGNDTLYGGKGADVFIYSGGDDFITDYTAGTDSIQIDTVDVEITGRATVGSSVIISTEKGDLTVTRASGKAITLIDADGNPIDGGVTLPAGWQYTNVNKQIQALATSQIEDLDLTDESGYGDGVTVVDAKNAKTGVNITTSDQDVSVRGSKYNDIVVGGTGDNTVSLGAGADVYIHTGGEDYIHDYVAGVDTIQVDTSATPFISAETVANNVVVHTQEGNITIKGGKGKEITLVDENGDSLLDDPFPSGWKLDSKGTLVSATSSSTSDLDLTEDYGENIIKVDGSKSLSVNVKGNDKGNSIKGGKGDDVIEGGTGNDTVSLGAGADMFVYTGGDDLIQDYVAGMDTIKVINDISVDAMETVGSNIVYTTSDGDITVKGGKGKTITLVDGDDNIINVGPDTVGAEGWKVDSQGTSMTATVKSGASDLDLTEDEYENIEKVDGSKLTAGVEIIGNVHNNSIKGGKGSDTIHGGSGNDTVSLGGGADVYVYTEGDDVIQDYSTVDTIQFESEILSASLNGSNLVITTDAGDVTVLKGKDKKVSVIDADGSDYVIVNEYPSPEALPDGLSYNTAKTQLTATTVFSGDVIDLSEYADSDSVTKIDASKLKSGVEIIGNDLGNSIKAGSGNDTLLGGEGNDTLTGGNGNDVFIYNGGDDVITDYKAGQDSIQINTTNIDVENIATVGSNVVINTELGSITIKSGRGKEISLFDENGEELWFDDDNNFVSNYKTIDSITEITEDNYSAGKIDLGQDVNVVNPDDYIAAYSEQNK